MFPFRKYGFDVGVADFGEKNMDMSALWRFRFAGLRVEAADHQLSGNIFLFIGVFQVCRRFGNDDDIGLQRPFGEIPKPAQRHQAVFEYRPVIVHKHYGYGRRKGPVLQSIVEYYKVLGLHVLVDAFPGFFGCFQFHGVCQKAAALNTVPVDGYGRVRKLPFDLKRLVPVCAGRSLCGNLLESFRLSFVSARKDGDILSGPLRVGG